MSVRHIDWLNENAYRKYPLLEGRTNEVPNGLIVDLSIPVPINQIRPDGVFLRRINGYTNGTVITFASVDNPTVDIAIATIFLETHSLNDGYAINGTAGLLGSAGRINIGTLTDLAKASQLQLDYTQNPTATLVAPSCIRPSLSGVTGVQVINSNDNSFVSLTGPLTFRSGTNVDISADPNTGVVTIGSGLIDPGEDPEDCGCGYDEEPPRPCIKSINGVLPDSEGNIQINVVGDKEEDEVREPTISITEGNLPGSLLIEDVTTIPCCECDELDQVYQAIQAIENESNTLFKAHEEMNSRILNMGNVISASALNPPSGNFPLVPEEDG